jgi:hypothetical protein
VHAVQVPIHGAKVQRFRHHSQASQRDLIPRAPKTRNTQDVVFDHESSRVRLVGQRPSDSAICSLSALAFVADSAEQTDNEAVKSRAICSLRLRDGGEGGLFTHVVGCLVV